MSSNNKQPGSVNSLISRRSLLGSIAGGASLIAGSGVFAQESPVQFILKQKQAEWQEQFDTSAHEQAAVYSGESVLSPNTQIYLEQAIQYYAGITQRGGWPVVPADTRLKLGVQHQNVEILRARLMISGDLRQNAGRSTIFDSYVDAALKRFQARHGLETDGIAASVTFAAVNVPATVRLRQLETNFVRTRSLSGSLGKRYVMVNIPAAHIETVEGSSVYSRHTAVVGKIDRPTPVLNSKIHEINFNPYWHVPVSIIRRDLIPKMQKEPDYLLENRIHIYDRKGNELSATDVNWSTDEATQYLFRQEPGQKNSLGNVRINFRNTHQVYLHDTPSKTLFGTTNRFHSSGCVRVQGVRDFVSWLLKDNGRIDRAGVDEIIRGGERLDVRVRRSVPIYMTYITAWSSSLGVVHFREDIYNRDGLGSVAAVTDPV
ncbi:MAG: murein L,D-transpeptidase [Hyphomicrobiales bacterium]|nr:MAG: murein L,D-transpeptidase [Hyphomicrobiales bacterium]